MRIVTPKHVFFQHCLKIDYAVYYNARTEKTYAFTGLFALVCNNLSGYRPKIFGFKKIVSLVEAEFPNDPLLATKVLRILEFLERNDLIEFRPKLCITFANSSTGKASQSSGTDNISNIIEQDVSIYSHITPACLQPYVQCK